MLDKIRDYYSEKVTAHGDTHRGVDWNSEQSQTMRFYQLSKVLPADQPFSVNDLGCGYGAFCEYLESTYKQPFSYIGTDISQDMISAAKKRLVGKDRVSLRCASNLDPADYTIASGIFNVRLEATDGDWLEYIQTTIDAMNEASRFGFSFNVLSKYSDKEFWREYLYYADPLFLFDRCCTRYSRRVALNHDYGLYEFTIVVRKETG